MQQPIVLIITYTLILGTLSFPFGISGTCAAFKVDMVKQMFKI